MKNTNTKEYKNTVREYLRPIIIDALECREKSTEGNIFSSIVAVARGECPEYFRVNIQDGLRHWLQGLGMGIDFTNYDILQLAEQWHECKLTDKEADTIIGNWFNHIAFKILQFSREEAK